jgi:hypothetical protein
MLTSVIAVPTGLIHTSFHERLYLIYYVTRFENYLGPKAHPGVRPPFSLYHPPKHLPTLALPHELLQRYLRAFASWHGLNSNDISPNVSYRTRVERAVKIQGGEWTLTLKRVTRVDEKRSKVEWWTEVNSQALLSSLRLKRTNSRISTLSWSLRAGTMSPAFPASMD